MTFTWITFLDLCPCYQVIDFQPFHNHVRIDEADSQYLTNFRVSLHLLKRHSFGKSTQKWEILFCSGWAYFLKYFLRQINLNVMPLGSKWIVGRNRYYLARKKTHTCVSKKTSKIGTKVRVQTLQFQIRLLLKSSLMWAYNVFITTKHKLHIIFFSNFGITTSIGSPITRILGEFALLFLMDLCVQVCGIPSLPVMLPPVMLVMYLHVGWCITCQGIRKWWNYFASH